MHPALSYSLQNCPGLVMSRPVQWLSRNTNPSDCSLRQGARPLKGTYKGDLFTYFFGFFGSIWAHKGPYWQVWAHIGTARALEEWEKFRKTHGSFFSKTIVFDFHTAFCNGFDVFFRFLAEIRLRAPIKSPQKPSSRPKTCKVRTTCTLP